MPPFIMVSNWLLALRNVGVANPKPNPTPVKPNPFIKDLLEMLLLILVCAFGYFVIMPLLLYTLYSPSCVYIKYPSISLLFSKTSIAFSNPATINHVA